ncbi:unnamed protein product [Nippostrongylus brasiliensis]|uniref:Uncharacterized protein n=1 Tax=Nippostrongylus brasiliensis TaxID=27835 RepID=A0A0N4YJG2_NIPBR|nr:unnamed protein product [Nippostrongylus brasiliensis]
MSMMCRKSNHQLISAPLTDDFQTANLTRVLFREVIKLQCLVVLCAFLTTVRSGELN